MYYGDKWNPENDWSYDGLTIYDDDSAFFSTGNEVKFDNICVYTDGVHVGGTEPDGSKPDTEESTSESTSSSDEKDILYGDANCDGIVNIADAVIIMQSLSNADKYNISEEGQKNADVISVGDGITNKDALAIQMLEAKLLKQADLPLDNINM